MGIDYVNCTRRRNSENKSTFSFCRLFVGCCSLIYMYYIFYTFPYCVMHANTNNQQKLNSKKSIMLYFFRDSTSASWWQCICATVCVFFLYANTTMRMMMTVTVTSGKCCWLLVCARVFIFCFFLISLFSFSFSLVRLLQLFVFTLAAVFYSDFFHYSLFLTVWTIAFQTIL